MKAIVCKKFAPVSDLVWEEVADPVAGPGEIVIDVKAAGLNYPDNLIVQGLYQFRPERPFSPGHEGAGIVSSVGEGVKSTRLVIALLSSRVLVPLQKKLCCLKLSRSQFLTTFHTLLRLVCLWFMVQAITP